MKGTKASNSLTSNSTLQRRFNSSSTAISTLGTGEKPTSFMVWLWHLKLNSTTENKGVFSQTKKVPQWKVRCLKNKWFYSSAGHYRYSSNGIDLLVVYFNLCFLNLWRYLRTILTCKSDGNAKQIYKCNLVLLQYSMHVIFLCVKIWILDLNTWFRKY